MRHLSPDQLLDVAEGTRTGREFPHLESCALCARQLADLRNAISAARAVQVPEPSPLFWDHLSARIRTAVESEPPARGSLWFRGAGWRLAPLAAVLGAILLVIWPGAPRVSSPVGNGAPTAVADPTQADDLRAFDDDPALALLADLSVGLDWDAASEAGLVPSAGTVDRVVFTLSVDERVELHRLLQEALAARVGA